MTMNFVDLQNMAVRRKIGASLKATAASAEAELDLTSLATTNGYPMTVHIDCRDASAYLIQGPTGIKLHATADRNLRLKADESVEITVDSASDAFISHERAGASDATLVATRIDKVTP